MKIAFKCMQCRKTARKSASAVNRARRDGMRLFCNRKCAGLARRKGKTKAQRVEEKRLYDAAYRIKNADMLKAKKREYHRLTYDPAAAAKHRKKNMARHVAYCRRPEYRTKKAAYDRRKRLEAYGPFAESVQILEQLRAEIATRMSAYQIRVANGYYTREAQRGRAKRRHANG